MRTLNEKNETKKTLNEKKKEMEKIYRKRFGNTSYISLPTKTRERILQEIELERTKNIQFIDKVDNIHSNTYVDNIYYHWLSFYFNYSSACLSARSLNIIIQAILDIYWFCNWNCSSYGFFLHKTEDGSEITKTASFG